MAKRASQEKAPIFLIMRDRGQACKLAEGVRQAGYNVTEYQTAREFLIDKRNHTGGIVFAELRLYGMQGDELAKELADERTTFPFVLIVPSLHTTRAIKAGVDFIVRKPAVSDLLDAIKRAQVPDQFDKKTLRWGFEKLTPGEANVLEGIIAGRDNSEIGHDLGISSKTLEVHRARVNMKTRARDVGERVRMWKAWQAMQ